MGAINLPEISEDLFGLVVKLNNTIFRQEEFLKCMPFPPSHVKVIVYLVHKGSATMSEMAYHLSISKSNLTPIIDKLFQEGFVKRSEMPKDRRTVLIEVTDLAIEQFDRHKQLVKDRLAARIEHLTPEDLQKLHESIRMALPLLDKVNDSQ